jgi:membrane protease YdiL (CAAX protease family)
MQSSETSQQHDSPPDARRAYLLTGGIVGGMVLLIVVGLLAGGEIGQFVQMGVQYVPFIVLALIGTLGLQQEWARWLSYIYALGLQALLALFVLMYFFLGVTEETTTLPDGTRMPDVQGPEFLLIGVMVLLLLLLFVACSAVLLPRVRPWLARWLPIDPANDTHIIALWVVLFMTSTAYVQLMLLGGQPPLLTAVRSGLISPESEATRSELGQNLSLIYGLIWLLPLALFGAGWPLKRTLSATLQRLGMWLPTWRQVAFALVAAVALSFLMGLLGEWLSALWNWLGWPETDADAFEELLGGLISPLGALVIGFTAGLGEEVAVRGLLQPRLGLLLSNLAFTAIHAYQYSFDALLVVFLLGMLLGIIRNRTNTSTAAIVHGVYNATSVLAGLFGW